MTKRPWTPGPWFSLKYASGRGEDWGIGIPSGDGYIAVARVHRVAQRDTAHEEANARLIAASPLMAEYIAKSADEGDEEAAAIWRQINA